MVYEKISTSAMRCVPIFTEDITDAVFPSKQENVGRTEQ